MFYNKEDLKRASSIGDAFNNFGVSGDTVKAFAESEDWTPVRNCLKFAFDLIRYTGSGKLRRFPDARNQASTDTCIAVYNAAKDILEPEAKNAAEEL